MRMALLCLTILPFARQGDGDSEFCWGPSQLPEWLSRHVPIRISSMSVSKHQEHRRHSSYHGTGNATNAYIRILKTIPTTGSTLDRLPYSCALCVLPISFNLSVCCLASKDPYPHDSMFYNKLVEAMLVGHPILLPDYRPLHVLIAHH